MRDNCAEILNVCSRLFTSNDQHRVTLTGTCFAPAALPEQARALLARGERLELSVDIDKYGTGAMVLVVAG